MSNQERTRKIKEGAPRLGGYAIWPGSQQGLPTREPTIRIIFHGLLCLFFEGNRGCYVGTHNTTGAGHKHPHQYVVRVWKKTNGQCPPRPQYEHTIGNPQHKPTLNIAVTNPDQLDGTYVYTRGPFTRPDSDNRNDPNDWRWMIDFDEVNSLGTRVNHEKLGNGVRIDNGLFYTLRKTCAKFALRPGGQPDDTKDIPFGSVAQIIAANIYLKPDGMVTLSGGPFRDPLPLQAGQGESYQIDIFNDCHDGQKKCEFTPTHPSKKEERNDFYLYYQIFDPPAPDEYELVLSKPCKKALDIDRELKEMGVCEVDRERSTDDAPCGATGFGRTPPPPPPPDE